MKKYIGNSIYRGCAYDFTLCAKSMKEVAEIMDTTLHQVRTYWGCGRTIPKVDIFSDIIVTPYGTKALLAIDATRETMFETMTLEEFKNRVDLKMDKNYEQYVNDFKNLEQ